ncbi:unnamed protein product [Acanthoscelides obtectus]|uniref:Guided entry of tail-anchored proteins factor 1 n=1 Tax=Acanthoscelides obtectus TaxID=200917 RepID=A0A9P0PVL9_ACAOB|nr:unnamed protein product [Acanthoscelides obtectus]CAK1648556.1 Tail-anchored protein insertion receptor WRB [Acanthoscelides obtectus]
MILLIVSSCLSFLSVHSFWVGSQVLKLVNRPTRKEKDLLSKKRDLKQEQILISMSDNFVKYSKIQRKINAIDGELATTQEHKNNWSLKFGLTYGARIIFGITLVILSIYYRLSPVFVVDKSLDLAPFTYIISYPNENNAVTFHFWVLCCTAVAKLIKL